MSSNQHLLTEKNARDLWDYFAKKERLKLKPKRDSRLMVLAATALTKLGVIKNEGVFLDNMYTTVRRTIYYPEARHLVGLDDPVNCCKAMETICHEVTHVRQNISSVRYLMSKKALVRAEAPAYAANIELYAFFNGWPRSARWVAEKLLSYGIKRDSAEYRYVFGVLQMTERMARRGVYRNRAVKEAIAFLK